MFSAWVAGRAFGGQERHRLFARKPESGSELNPLDLDVPQQNYQIRTSTILMRLAYRPIGKGPIVPLF